MNHGKEGSASCDSLHQSLELAGFAFAHPDIANAVIRDHKRGVQVRMVMDLKNASGKDSRIPDLIKAGIEVPTRHKDGDQHSKYLIIDKSIDVTGNFNYTARADERDSENIVVIRYAPKAALAISGDYWQLRSRRIEGTECPVPRWLRAPQGASPTHISVCVQRR